MQLYNVLVQVQFVTGKTKLQSRITNLVYELLNELPKDLRLAILGNYEILENRYWWRYSIASSLSSRNWTLVINPKIRRSRYQNFLVLSNFTGFLYFVQNIFSGIVGPGYGSTSPLRLEIIENNLSWYK